MRVQPFLTALGARLRAYREAAHLSVTETARQADLSRRYLTEAEAGRANPSASVLARLAVTLGVPLRELVDLPLRQREEERLALVGLRGAGKTTLGRRLARELEVPFVELDQRIEELAGLPLGELFEVHGEEGYRRFQREALERVLAEGGRLVLATGGSIVSDDQVFARLRGTCRTIWLRARPEEHFLRVLEQGDRRPMRDRPRAMEELRALLDRRAPLYARCDLTVDTSGRTSDEVVAAVLAELEKDGVGSAS